MPFPILLPKYLAFLHPKNIRATTVCLFSQQMPFISTYLIETCAKCWEFTDEQNKSKKKKKKIWLLFSCCLQAGRGDWYWPNSHPNKCKVTTVVRLQGEVLGVYDKRIWYRPFIYLSISHLTFHSLRKDHHLVNGHEEPNLPKLRLRGRKHCPFPDTSSVTGVNSSDSVCFTTEHKPTGRVIRQKMSPDLLGEGRQTDNMLVAGI